MRISLQTNEPKQPFVTVEFEGQKVRLLVEEKHPNDDPAYPSYHHPSYQRIRKDIEFVHDMIDGKAAWCRNGEIHDWNKAARYLPKDALEDRREYAIRAQKTNFASYTREAYEEFPALISLLIPNEEIPESLRDSLEDIDLSGNDIQKFFFIADQHVLSDGLVGILCEYPSDPIPGDSPYLALVKRKDILNWKIRKSDRQNFLAQITIREYHTQDLEDGGEITFPLYRIYYADGSSQLWAIAYEDSNPKGIPFIVEENQNSIGRSPFLLYTWGDTLDFEVDPILLSIAEANLDYFLLYAEYRQAIWKFNIPVPVRKGLITPGSKKAPPPLHIGANTAIDVPSDGDFYFAVPGRDALEITQRELENLGIEAKRRSLRFLADHRSVLKTAYEVRQETIKVEASIYGLLNAKESLLESLCNLWALYTNEEHDGAFKIARDFIRAPLDFAEIDVYSRLAEKNQLTLRSLLRILKEGSTLFDRNFDIEQEVQELEKKIQEERAMAAMNQQFPIL